MTAGPAAPPPGTRRAQIGADGQPVRAIAFGGGQFDTAMQLGVIHALLVSRGRPPDVVIGVSAGAVNAVALAEVLQQGDEEQRVARFRQIYERFLSAPGQLTQALRPDVFQIDAQRPLEPVSLPIHSRAEREEREESVAARAGLINLYNALLAFDVTFGTLTRAIRRVLGLWEANADPEPWRRRLRKTIEQFRTWMLLGHNLHRLRLVVWPLLRALWRKAFARTRGATAAELIFQSASLALARRVLVSAFSLSLLIVVWLGGSALVLGLIWVLGIGPALLLDWVRDVGPAVHALALAVGAAFCAAAIAVRREHGRLQAFALNLWTVVTFGALAAGWAAVLVAAVSLPLVAVGLARRAAPGWQWLNVPEYWAAAGAAALVLLAGSVALVLRGRGTMGRWLLAQYRIDEALFNAYPLRQFLTGLLDPAYYGRPEMAEVIERSMRGDRSPGETRFSEKRLDTYAADAAGRTPIHVLVATADVGSGELKVLPGSWRVIDGLTAALATVPLFPPVPCDGKALDPDRRTVSLLVDARVVANDPTRPLFAFLRRSPDVNRKAAALLLYNVAPLPVSQPQLGVEREPDGSKRVYTRLVDIVLRALELRRFRDAALEARLTELHTKAMPKGSGIFYPEDAADGEKKLLRTWVYPIEPEQPLHVTEQVLQMQSEDDRRRMMARTVADGCRAALQTMLHTTLQDLKPEPAPAPDAPVDADGVHPRLAPCRAAVEPRTSDKEPLAGSDRTAGGPGLSEVCEHCAIFRHVTVAQTQEPLFPRQLRMDRNPKRPIPDWPAWTAPARPWEDYDRIARSGGETAEIAKTWRGEWPRPKDGAPGDRRPTVSLLFSGGVFRGVFQVGVLNGLSEVGLQPDIVAGASVGSITAAMAARAFVDERGRAPAGLAERQRQVLRLAAAYLGIDRLVLTDRFADFIRGITVRAAQARFSLREADRVIRRFDDARAGRFSREVRRVVAGIERLTYVSPFELYELLEAFRRERWGRVLELLRWHAQEWLERVGVPHEVLGAEPLERLIDEYVLRGLGDEARVPLNVFADRLGVFLLATATDLSQGRLHVIGEEQLAERQPGLTLLDTLLTSSAFPGVFRPRWRWEFDPAAAEHHQYIDGGVMDNLPLDAVAQFLHGARRGGLITADPAAAPHLVFCASLEPDPGVLGEAPLDELRHNWPRLLSRARKLGYNDKLRMFRHTQRNLLTIVRRRRTTGPAYASSDWQPLAIELVTVIPRWLCSTFGFHPMLGFRRSRQAESIAHGCASTLRVFADQPGESLAAWGVSPDRLPPREAPGRPSFARHPNARDDRGGACWYQPGFLCPFSTAGQAACKSGFTGATAGALAEVHRACGRAATHGGK